MKQRHTESVTDLRKEERKGYLPVLAPSSLQRLCHPNSINSINYPTKAIKTRELTYEKNVQKGKLEAMEAIRV